MVPCTEMRKSYYLEPVITCHDPCANPCPTGAATDGGRTPNIPPAGIGESSDRAPGGGIGETSEPPRLPRVDPGSRRFVPTPSKTFRSDRVASRTNSGRLQGQVVRDDRITPRANATLRFVGEKDEQITAKADLTGRFAVELPAGEWTLYVPSADGKQGFHSTVSVRHSDDRRVTVVSR
jgi:hypothetical protein